MADYYRPNFFTNTPDINPYYLQNSGRPGFVVRSTLAATLSSNWGIYSGFELCEAAPLPGREEYLDSEKYQLRARDFDAPGNIRAHIAALNRIRRENPALHDFRNTLFLNAWNDNLLAYLRATPQRDNAIMIIVNLDPHHAQTADYEVPLWEFGLPDSGTIEVEDLLLGTRFNITGKIQSVTLNPRERSVAIWRLSLP
jgi:starch synthase (maltosyl-transferring)